jgi:hypothetical protein
MTSANGGGWSRRAGDGTATHTTDGGSGTGAGHDRNGGRSRPAHAIIRWNRLFGRPAATAVAANLRKS